MRAMVLAAGLGTRLRPLTDHRPKALVEVGSRTLLEITLARLRQYGVREVIVNLHHFADMVADYLEKNDSFGMRIELSREDDVLLDTGGGLKQAAWFFLEKPDEPFLVHNVDVLSDIDLERLLQAHRRRGALATLAVQQRPTSRALLFDRDARLCGRRVGNNPPELVAAPPVSLGFSPRSPGFGLGGMQELAFCGIHVISPRIFSLISEEGVFPISPCYLRLAGQGEKIASFRADQYRWRDLGRPDDLRQAAADLKDLK